MNIPTRSEKQSRGQVVQNVAYLQVCFDYTDKQIKELFRDASFQRDKWSSEDANCKGTKLHGR